MKQLIVENKIGTHFNFRKSMQKSIDKGHSLSIELLNNEFCVIVQDYKTISVMMTIPYNSIKERKKTGHSGYNNLIKITLNSILKKEYKTIRSDYSVNVINHRKFVNGQEVIYVTFSARIRSKKFENLLSENTIKEMKDRIVKNVSDPNPYKYRYI
jgi:hypothetical protein